MHYNILESVIVENIIPRNVIINRGAAEVDNHISRDDIYFNTPNIIPLFSTIFPLTMVREVQRTAQCVFATNG